MSLPIPRSARDDASRPPGLQLAALAARLPPSPLTRFAPSPTGWLHLGHVVNAVYVWGIARALGGRVLLRFEDHDRGRCRPEYERGVVDDLAWLGLRPDVGHVNPMRVGSSPYRQSNSSDAYEEALDRLRSAGRVFACDCSRKEMAAAAGDAPNEETPYLGRCRDRALPETHGHGLRVVVEPGVERFDDALLGPQAQEPARQCGDLLVRDRLGRWTYQFAVTVDDMRHGVDLVVRGVDLLSSTGRQLRLARQLGRRAPPVFLHHPLVLKPGGMKLSKSDGDSGIRELRAAGASPAAVLGRAAYLGGLLEQEREVQGEELALLFSDPLSS